jgi:hypothetical protein
LLRITADQSKRCNLPVPLKALDVVAVTKIFTASALPMPYQALLLLPSQALSVLIRSYPCQTVLSFGILSVLIRRLRENPCATPLAFAVPSLLLLPSSLYPF